jgi:hypothetical protein
MPLSTTNSAVDLADRAGIEALLYEHYSLVDSGQARRVHALYTDDACIAGLGSEDLVGREVIKAWGVTREKQKRITRHIISNITFVRLFDGRVLAAYYLTLYRHDGSGRGSSLPFLIADCEDTMKLESDGCWRIREHRIRPIFVAEGTEARG